MTPNPADQAVEAIARTADLLPPQEREGYFAEMRRRYSVCLAELVRAGAVFPGGEALDIGTSPGYMALALTAMGMRVTGLDFDPDHDFLSLGVNRRAWLGERGVEVRQCDIMRDQFPVGDRSMDLAIFNETLEHLPDTPQKPILEIRRALKPGGFLLVTTPNAVSLKRRLRFLAGRNVFAAVEEYCDLESYKRHNREYALGEIVWLLERCGLRPVRTLNASFYLFRPGSPPLKRIMALPYLALCRAFPGLATDNLVIARRE